VRPKTIGSAGRRKDRPTMANWTPEDPIYFSRRTCAAVLCLSTAFFALGALLLWAN
jgi:hypothetical protein